MKLTRWFKLILYMSLAVLYATGVITWVLDIWFRVDDGFGPQPRPSRALALHLHGVVGLGFLIAFGYLLHAHVRPGLRGRSHRRSGIAILAITWCLIATLPFLYYSAYEGLRAVAANAHTWVGLASVLPFFGHLFVRRVMVRPIK